MPRQLVSRATPRTWPLVEAGLSGALAGAGAGAGAGADARTTSADCRVRFCWCSASFSCCSASSCAARSDTRFSVSACFACTTIAVVPLTTRS